MCIYQKVTKPCCSRGCCPWRRSQSLSGAHKTHTHTRTNSCAQTHTRIHTCTLTDAHSISLSLSRSLSFARACVRAYSLFFSFPLFLYPLSRFFSHPLVHAPTLSYTRRETLPSSKSMAQRAPPKRLNSAGYTHVRIYIYISICMHSFMHECIHIKKNPLRHLNT